MAQIVSIYMRTDGIVIFIIWHFNVTSGTCNVLWNMANWTWGECQLVEEILVGNPPGVDANLLRPPWADEPWDAYKASEEEKKKRKRLIKLICKVKGISYDEEKTMKEFKVTVEDVKIIVKAVANIDLDLKLNKE